MKTLHNLQLQDIKFHCFIFLLNSCKVSPSFKLLGSEDYKEQPLS